ncbi:MAG: endolytic transglycosylase MltG [Clostridia bacterium]|nr:endolytic transglycosylase MltG [Clostridia bacterium]
MISTLKENGVIKSDIAFKIYIRLNNISNFQAGKYTMNKSMTVPEVAEALQKGIMFKDSSNITFVE